MGLALPIIWEPFVKNWHNGGLYLFVPVTDATVPFMPIPGLLILLVGLLLAAFDGVLAIQSPIGGPTSVHIALPVES